MQTDNPVRDNLQTLERKVLELLELVAKLKKENKELREARALARSKVERMLAQLKKIG